MAMGFVLFPQAEPGDDAVIALLVFFAHVLEQRSPCGNHFEQSAARGMVLAVALEMLGKLVDSLGQNRNLDLRRAGVALMNFEVLNDTFLFCF